MPRTGGCLCGAIRYAIEGDPVAYYLCHCTDCQHASGGAYAACAMVREDDFRLLRGEPRRFERRADSGNIVVRAFCGDCGSQLFSIGPSRPGSRVVRVGTLDDTRRSEPQLHIWVDSALRWAIPPDDAPRYAKSPDSDSR